MTTTTPTLKPTPPSLLVFPEGEKTMRYGRPSYEAACYGNERIAVLLDYFVYQASLEIDRWLRSEPCSEHGERCKDERCKSERAKGCKVVKVERSHADILSKLPVHLCRKTLIDYLDKLDAWGYIASEAYARNYSVNFEAIQTAVSTPPEPEKRKRTGGRKPKGEEHSEQSCNVVVCESCKVVEMKLSELEEKVVMLQQNVSFFQLKVGELQLKVGELQLSNPSSARSEMRLQGPFESLLSFTDITVLSCQKEIVGSAIASPTPSLVLSAEKESIQDAMVEVAVSPPVQSSPIAPAPVVVESPVDSLTVQATSTRQPAKNKEKPPKPSPEDEALTARCKAIQAKVNELRGFRLKKTGLIIDESKVIREHLAREDFTDERIERIHQYLTTQYWKYKGAANRGDVGARVIWEESGRAEAVIVPPVTTHATTGYLGAPIAWGTPGYNFADEFYPSEAEKRMMYAAHSTIQ